MTSVTTPGDRCKVPMNSKVNSNAAGDHVRLAAETLRCSNDCLRDHDNSRNEDAAIE